MPFEVVECETHKLDSKTTSWIEFGFAIPLCVVLHFVLFFYGLTRVIDLRKQNRIICAIPLLFSLIQILAMLTDVNELIRLVVASRWYQHWFFNPVYCYLSAVQSRICVPLFYLCLCNLLLVRLKVTFKNSVVAISNRVFISLATLSVCIGAAVIFVTLYHNSPCIRYYRANDIDQTLAFCRTNYERDANYTSYVINLGFAFVVVYDIVLGVLFVSKLKKIIGKRLNVSVANDYKLENVMVKNTLLTLFTASSTLLTFLIYMTLDGFNFFLYLDWIFNCVMIELMYVYNDKYYKCLCKPCIVCLLKVFGVQQKQRDVLLRTMSISSNRIPAPMTALQQVNSISTASRKDPSEVTKSNGDVNGFSDSPEP